ncbi:MAG TPA: Bax inhibitor-1 family protein, partial [Pirellulaceae bacterium]|nr:Bax inhibitor-1 family protein [Pirellulaceae bacterium]
MTSRPNWQSTDYASISPVFAATAAASERAAFIRNTYLHMAGAIFAFIVLELIYFTLFRTQIESAVVWLQDIRWGWLLVLGGFIGVSWIAESWARGSDSRGMQYAGLGLYVLAESVIFAPLLFIANHFFEGAITSAALMTLIITVGLSLVVYVSRVDFSFMRMFLYFGGLAALSLIVASLVVGFHMGVWFPLAMVVLAGGYILYQTSNIL